MSKLQKIRFEHISHMKLLDLKSQKMTVNFKKFYNIPLSFQEKVAQTCQASSFNRPYFINEQIKPKKDYRIVMKKLKELSIPRQYQQKKIQNQQDLFINSIIRKCDRLKKKVLTDKKLVKFQRDTVKCYNYLFQLSNFNFRKYQSDTF